MRKVFGTSHTSRKWPQGVYTNPIKPIVIVLAARRKRERELRATSKQKGKKKRFVENQPFDDCFHRMTPNGGIHKCRLPLGIRPVDAITGEWRSIRLPADDNVFFHFHALVLNTAYDRHAKRPGEMDFFRSKNVDRYCLLLLFLFFIRLRVDATRVLCRKRFVWTRRTSYRNRRPWRVTARHDLFSSWKLDASLAPKIFNRDSVSTVR